MHSDALSMLLRSRGTASQFLDPRVGGITRAAVYIAVSLSFLEVVVQQADLCPGIPQSNKENITGSRSGPL